jgi:hypothetical protein
MRLIHIKDTLLFFHNDGLGILFIDINEDILNWYAIGDTIAYDAHKNGEFDKALDSGLFKADKMYKLCSPTNIFELNKDIEPLIKRLKLNIQYS